MRKTVEAAGRVSTAEGDRICGAVLRLVESLVRGHHAAHRYEPTGITVAPEMRSYVDEGA